MIDLQRSSGLHSRALTDVWPPSHSCCTSRLSFPCLVPPCVHRPQTIFMSSIWPLSFSEAVFAERMISPVPLPNSSTQFLWFPLRQAPSLGRVSQGTLATMLTDTSFWSRRFTCWKQLFALWQAKPKELAAGQENWFQNGTKTFLV